MKRFTDNEKEHFIAVCNKAQTMARACAELEMGHNTFKKYAIMFGCYRPNQSGKGTKKKSKSFLDSYKIEDILSGKYPQYNSYKLKKKLYASGIKEDRCEICGWSEKRPGEKYSPCELHHIDGNPHNHTLSNLQILCPNCHSLTVNYRSKNRAGK